MKKRILSLLLVFCMVLSLLPTAAFATSASGDDTAEPDTPFTDVKQGDWFYDAVRYVSANGIFNGTGGNAFSPNAGMTRAMFVTVLGRLAGIDPADYSGDTGMADVPEDAWYAPYVKWAMQFGITLGTGDGKFSPDVEIDRSQMAVFFVRYFEAFDVAYETGAEVTTTPADLDSVPDYAKDSVLKLWRQGLLNGDGVNFAPTEKANRAQVATLSQRVDKAVETWYSEPGIPSERKSVDPDAQQPQQPEEEKKPAGGSSGNSGFSGNSSSNITTYYEVRFAPGEGQAAEGLTLPDTQSAAKGDAISTLPTPSKTGAIFLGWYYDAALTKPAAGSDTIEKNMTLYARLAEGEAVQPIETPNYITKTDVEAGDYTFGVTGVSSKSEIKFINVTGGNLAVEFDLDGDTVSAALEAGQTYQVELLNDAAKFVIGEEPQSDAIRYLNLLTKKKEVKSAKLNESVEQLSLTNVGGLAPGAFDGLFIIDETNTAAENTTTGRFTYNGDGLNIGDTVAITSGNVDLNDPTSTDGDVAYLKITGKDRDTYTYEMADVEDVLFMPDVLPIESSWDMDGDRNNSSITISPANLATAMANVDAEALDNGDFLGFITGSYSSERAAAESYGRITSHNVDSDGNYVIIYEEATEMDIENALDVYYTDNPEVALSQEEIDSIENEIRTDVVESGYATQAASYIAAVMLESNNLSTVPDMDAVEARLNEIEPYILATGTSVQMANGNQVKPEFNPDDIRVSLSLHSELDHLQGDGFHVSIEIPFKVSIGSGENKVVINIVATFEEEIVLSQRISTKRHKIGFLKYDYSLNASFEVGNYTGISFTANITTENEEVDESMVQKLDEIMEAMAEYHEESEGGGITTTGGNMEGLADIYHSVMENANDTWINIVEVKLFENNGNAFLHIFCWQIKGTFVVSANLAVSMGMSFEYITQKQYNFSVRVKAKTSTNETIDIITPEYNFDFYVVGTIGIRAGIRLEMYVGLFSLKLDKIGITAEAGAYAQLWGYFFYHLNWIEGQGRKESSAGAMLIEIGMYLDIKFVAQVFSSSKLTWNPTIYAHQWPLWSAGEQQNVYAFADPLDDSYALTSVRTFTLPSSTFNMTYMDLKSGDTGTVNKDSAEASANEKHFTVVFSDPDFSYDAATNTVTVGGNADVTGDATDMIITWKKAALSFSSKPIQKVIHISWRDPAGVRYLNFDSNGGSTVGQITGVAEQSIDLTTVVQPTMTGYDFAGWYRNRSCTGDPVTTVTLPASGSNVKGITLYAKWVPSNNTKYTVEHYMEQLNGTYALTYTDTRNGTTGTRTAVTPSTYDNYAGWGPNQKTIAPDGSTVVKVYYDLNTHIVTFKDGYSEESDNDIVRTYKHGEPLALPTFARDGYTFFKWDRNFEVNEEYDPIATKAETYTALWTANDNSISFNSMGGSAVSPATVKTDAKITKPSDPTMENYVFKGWFTDSACTRQWSFETDTVTGPMILYAKWEGEKYTVTLDPAGGTLTDTTLQVTFGAGYGTLPTPELTGYCFLGWFTDATNGEQVTADTPVTPSADGQTLYAHWTEADVIYTVKHHQQGYSTNNYKEVTADRQELTGKTGSLTAAEARTYEGFKAANAFAQETIAADGTTVVNIYYDRETYAVTWVTDDETEALTGTYTCGQDVRYGTPIKKPNTPHKPDTDEFTYTFAGWYTAATDGSKVEDFGTVTDNVTYYAHWTATTRKYDVSWHSYGVSLSGHFTEGPVDYGTQIVAPDNPTKTGYSFVGWSRGEGGDEDDAVKSFGTVTGDVAYYTIWKARTYTVTFDLNGNDNASMDTASKTVTFGDRYNTLPTLTNTNDNLKFDGWYTEAEGGTEVDSSTTVSTARDHTLYAHWKQKRTSYPAIQICGVALEVDEIDQVVGYKDTIEYDDATKTLTLKNATITCSGLDSVHTHPALSLSGTDAYTIKLIGDNSIIRSSTSTTSTSDSTHPVGLYSGGSITFTGDGTLTVTASNATSDYSPRAISTCGSMTIDGPTISASAQTGNYGYGIDMLEMGNIQVKSGSLTAQGTKAAIHEANMLCGSTLSTSISIESSANYDGSGVTTETKTLAYGNLSAYKYIKAQPAS